MSQLFSLNSASKDNFVKWQQGWTNNSFRVKTQDSIIYYLPAYLRIKFKNIVSVDLFTLTGEVNCTFILSIFYGDMQPAGIEYLQKSIQIAFHKSGAFQLNDDNLEVIRKNDTDKQLMTFTIRKVVATRLQGRIFWSPFQTIRFMVSLTLRSLSTTIDETVYWFKFNLMDCEDMDTKFSLSEQALFGIYKIAENQLEVKYSNQFSYFPQKRISRKIKDSKPYKSKESTQTEFDNKSKQKLRYQGEKEKEEIQPLKDTQRVKNFQYAHFVLPAYKKPIPSIVTVYFPLILLGIINIGIFYQNTRQSGKVMLNISAVLVSFIALIPTVRQNSAISPTVTFTQILVFIESFTTILTLVHMIEYRNDTEYVTSMATDGLLLASVVITSMIAFIIMVMIVLHKCYWKNKYHDKNKEKKELKFIHNKWKNAQSDLYFSRKYPQIRQCITSALSSTSLVKLVKGISSLEQ